jgi:Zn-dependent peptidase ImmA (M78 family)/transcriptional regulator with XRE-family HTH domain
MACALKGRMMGTRDGELGADRPQQPGVPPGVEGLFPVDEVREAFDPARLTQARLLKGLTKQELAGAVGVSPAAVGQWEAKIQIPKTYHLERIARALDVPVAYFLRRRPYARMNAAAAHFRSLRRTKVAHRDKALAFVEQLWEITYALERRVQLPHVDVPGLANGEHAPGVVPNDPVAAARLLREAWKVPEGPFRHLVNALENHGIVVSHVAFANEEETKTVDAFSTTHLPRPLVVTTPDRADDVYRHRYTVAHELGHILMHHDVAPGDLAQEREANTFAAELLTPIDQIAEELPTRLQMRHLDELSRRWGVSIKSLIKRTRELGLSTEVSARRAYQRYEQLHASGVLPGESIERYPGEHPMLLRKAYELAEHHGLLTLPQLAEELVWDLSRVRLLLGIQDQRPRLTLVH